MKKVAKIYKWVILSIILQVLLLCYFDFFYLGSMGGIKATAFETDSEEVSSKGMTLPSDADGIKVSNDGTLVAYLTGGKLELEGIKDSHKKMVPDHAGWELDYYTWLPDRAMVVCAYSSAKDETSLLITTYDFDNELERSYPELKGLRNGSRTADIEVSPYTNVVYFKVQAKGVKSRIYRFNIMDNIKYVMSLSEDSQICEVMYTDTLVYENRDKVYTRDGRSGNRSSISLTGKYVLLGVDSEDKVYLGKLNDEGNVTSVYYGMAGERSSKDWEHTTLKSPLPAEKLLISQDGTVFELDDTGKCINDIVSGKRLSYSGDFIQLLENYIVVKNGRKLQLTAYK